MCCTLLAKQKIVFGVDMIHGRGQSNKMRFLVNVKLHLFNVNSIISGLTVVSRAAKQNRTSDTNVCHYTERSILIECSLKAYHEKLPHEKRRTLLEQLRITSYISKISLHFFSNTLRNVDQSVVFSFAYSLRMWAWYQKFLSLISPRVS